MSKTRSIWMKLGVGSFVFMMAGIMIVPLASAQNSPIVIEPGSVVTSKAWVHHLWGHWNTTELPIAVPGNVTAVATHDGGMKSTTTSTVETPNDFEFSFTGTMNNLLPWSGYSNSNYTIIFTIWTKRLRRRNREAEVIETRRSPCFIA